jgi:hypothetical protein
MAAIELSTMVDHCWPCGNDHVTDEDAGYHMPVANPNAPSNTFPASFFATPSRIGPSHLGGQAQQPAPAIPMTTLSST